MNSELDSLARCYLGLAEQADVNSRLDVFAEFGLPKSGVDDGQGSLTGDVRPVSQCNLQIVINDLAAVCSTSKAGRPKLRNSGANAISHDTQKDLLKAYEASLMLFEQDLGEAGHASALAGTTWPNVFVAQSTVEAWR